MVVGGLGGDASVVQGFLLKRDENVLRLIMVMDAKLCEYTESLCQVHFFFLAALPVFGILVPPPGIQSGPSAVKAPSLNHWTPREFPQVHFKCVNFIPIKLFK